MSSGRFSAIYNLGAAVMVTAGLEGICEGLDSDRPHTENIYEYSQAQLQEMGIQF